MRAVYLVSASFARQLERPTLAVFSNEDPTSGWVPFTGTLAVETHAGETVELDLFALTDSSLITEFYVDSLVMTAEVCR